MVIRMRAVILEREGRLELRDNVVIEKPKKGEVLIKVLSCGVCHTDLHVIEGKVGLPLPGILGHEIYGVVEDVGEEVIGVKPGDHVVSSFMWPCGRCRYCVSGNENLCEASINARSRGVMLDGTTRVRLNDKPVYVRNGGFAEYAIVPSESSLVKLPLRLRIPEIGIAGCSLLTAYGAVFNTAGITHGERVAVYGVGGVGMAIVRFASIAGAEVIAIDVVDEKLRKARSLGASATINSRAEDPVKAIKDLTDGEGVDAAFEAIGMPITVRQATNSVRIGGRVVLIGLGSSVELELNPIVIRGIRLLGSYGGRPRIDLPKILRLIERGLIDLRDFVTGVYRLDEIEKALNDIKTGKAIRTIVIP